MENLIGATPGFLLILLLNPNCRGRGNVASPLRDSFRYEFPGTMICRDVHFQILGCVFRVGSKGICVFGLLDAVKLNEAPLRSCDHRLSPINHLELAEDILDMDFHGVLRDVQFHPDFLVTQAVGD